ncbi:MAG: flagellar hook-basal body complex protein FliE [Endozoicomonas sp.]
MQDLTGFAGLAQNRITLPGAEQATATDISSNPLSQRQGETLSVSRTEFSEVFKGALDHVNGLQDDADRMRTDIELGLSTDLVGTMIAGEKASLSFQGLIQVRNRVVSAYETVFNMPV